MLQVALAYNEMHILVAQSIREDVFIKEQNVPKELEQDGLDESSRHAIALYNYEPVGCARMRFLEDDKMKLERIAVLKPFRGKGIGKELVNFGINHAKEEGKTEIIIHVQLSVEKFYSKLGFTARGDEFEDAGIAHIEMVMEL